MILERYNNITAHLRKSESNWIIQLRAQCIMHTALKNLGNSIHFENSSFSKKNFWFYRFYYFEFIICFIGAIEKSAHEKILFPVFFSLSSELIETKTNSMGSMLFRDIDQLIGMRFDLEFGSIQLADKFICELKPENEHKFRSIQKEFDWIATKW